MADQIKQF